MTRHTRAADPALPSHWTIPRRRPAGGGFQRGAHDDLVGGRRGGGGLWAAFYVHYLARIGTLARYYPGLMRSAAA